jgi:uncharacterized membrane protein
MKHRLTIIVVLAMIGVAVSLYLLTVHWGWWQAVCLGVGDCEAVNQSRYSELLGVPVALLGALTYLAFIVCSVLIARDVLADVLRRAQFFVAAIGVAFSAYLTYIELFVLRNICPWCVLSAIVITLIAIFSAWELLATTSAQT